MRTPQQQQNPASSTMKMLCCWSVVRCNAYYYNNTGRHGAAEAAMTREWNVGIIAAWYSKGDWRGHRDR